MIHQWRIFKTRLLLVFMVVNFSGCTSEIEEYRTSTPQFNLFNYFSGHTLAWGMVQDYTSKQTRRFNVSLYGEIKENTLILTEDFIFSDGEQLQRIWRIERLKDDTYQGTAPGIIGYATGVESGNALRWQYDFELKVNDSIITVFFDDWLYRQDDKRAFNITSIQKFGVEVGRVTLFFEKQ